MGSGMETQEPRRKFLRRRRDRTVVIPVPLHCGEVLGFRAHPKIEIGSTIPLHVLFGCCSEAPISREKC